MQRGAHDYLDESGCCLNCEKAAPGCLCYECKCTKCEWYSSPYHTGTGKGKCDAVGIKKEQMRRSYIMNSTRKFLSVEKLYRLNTIKFIELKKENKVPNIYSCQQCHTKFVTEDELKIVKGKYPICDVCLNKIDIDYLEIMDYIEKHKLFEI